MKLLYLTYPFFFDLDISLIRELSKICDVTVVMILTPKGLKSSAFSLDSMDERLDIIGFEEYNGLDKYKGMIDTNRWYVANNPDDSIVSSYLLAKKIRSLAYDFEVIHSTNICKTTFFLLPYIRKCNKALLTVHDPIPHERISPIRAFFMNRFHYRSYHNLLFLSDKLVQSFNKKFGVNYSIFFSRLAVYDYLNQYEIGANKYGKYIILFGRMCSYKGINLFVNSFLKSECAKEYKLVIAGRGPVHPKYQSDSIIVLDRYIENEELATLIAHCEFVSLPYLSATQSGCLMTAYAFRKPVLATCVGDFMDVVKDGETGLIVEPNSEISLVNGLNRMCNSDLNAMSKNIESLSCVNPNAWQIIASDIKDVYESLLKKN